MANEGKLEGRLFDAFLAASRVGNTEETDRLFAAVASAAGGPDEAGAGDVVA